MFRCGIRNKPGKASVMKVVCYQPDLRAYRGEFFCALSDAIGGGLTVVHFGRQEWEGKGLEVVQVKRNFRSVFARLKRLIHLSRESDVCVAVFDIHYWDVFLAVFLARKGTRRIFWGHGLGRTRIGRVLRTAAAKMADGVIVYGKDGQRQLLEAGVPGKKVFVAPNTMWVNGYRNTANDKKDYFLFVGRIQQRKRLDLLIDAYGKYFGRVGRQVLGLLIVGDGIDARLLEKIRAIESVGGEVKWVAGTTDESRLAQIFAAAIAYVSPGAVGLGVLHAFAFGVPVVTCNAEGHGPEFENIVDKQNGLIIERDVNALANAMVSLTEDRDMSRRLADAAYETYRSSASPQAMLQGFMNALGIRDVRVPEIRR
jgi:glycosyltransferase involved in cell wall biosynthesis